MWRLLETSNRKKEISMAIVKMLLNRVEYPRKDIPDQVVIPDGAIVTFIDAGWAGNQTLEGGATTQKHTVNVKCEMANIYFCQVPENANDRIGLTNGDYGRASGTWYVGVRKSACTPVVQNGGGTA